MNRLLCGIACALVALAGLGCEKEVDRTRENMVGAWRAPFGDVVATITLDDNGYYVIEQDTDGTAGTQLFQVSAWGKNPPYGKWRMGDGEITFLVDEATAGGLEIGALYEDKVLFKANDGSPMYFKRVAASPVRAGREDDPADEVEMNDEAMEEQAAEEASGAGAEDE